MSAHVHAAYKGQYSLIACKQQNCRQPASFEPFMCLQQQLSRNLALFSQAWRYEKASQPATECHSCLGGEDCYAWQQAAQGRPACRGRAMAKRRGRGHVGSSMSMSLLSTWYAPAAASACSGPPHGSQILHSNNCAQNLSGCCSRMWTVLSAQCQAPSAAKRYFARYMKGGLCRVRCGQTQVTEKKVQGQTSGVAYCL